MLAVAVREGAVRVVVCVSYRNKIRVVEVRLTGNFLL